MKSYGVITRSYGVIMKSYRRERKGAEEKEEQQDLIHLDEYIDSYIH